MNRITKQRYLAATAFAGALFFSAGAANATTTDTLDISAGAGFSSNPRLRITNVQSSGFARISAYGNHTWKNERSSASIHGYIENTSYLKNYGSQRIFSLGADTTYTVSPTLSLYGNLDFYGDLNGQLSNRLIAVPSGPPVTDPNNPLPPVPAIPGVIGFSGHQYRLYGQVGASIRSSERSTISVTAGAQRSWFTANPDFDYNSYFGSLGYSLELSERTSIGPTVFVQYQDFTHGDSATIVNPVATVHTQLSESVVADAAVGILLLHQDRNGQTSNTVSPSFNGSICSQGTISRLCAHVAHDARSALNSGLITGGSKSSITTTAGVDYYRQLSEDATIQASLYATRYSASTSGINGQSLHTTYLSGVAGYDRKVGHRLYAGISGGVRNLFQSGPDPRADLNANIYLRYRF